MGFDVFAGWIDSVFQSVWIDFLELLAFSAKFFFLAFPFIFIFSFVRVVSQFLRDRKKDN